MKIVINPTSNRDQETLSFESIDNLHENFSKLLSFKGPLEVKIYAINELINSHQLLKIKNNFDKNNVYSFCIYSNNRDTIIAGKSLKIDSTFIKEQEVKNKFLLHDSKKKEAMNPGRSSSGQSADGFGGGSNYQNTKSYDPFGSKSRRTNKNQNFYSFN